MLTSTSTPPHPTLPLSPHLISFYLICLPHPHLPFFITPRCTLLLHPRINPPLTIPPRSLPPDHDEAQPLSPYSSPSYSSSSTSSSPSPGASSGTSLVTTSQIRDLSQRMGRWCMSYPVLQNISRLASISTSTSTGTQASSPSWTSGPTMKKTIWISFLVSDLVIYQSKLLFRQAGHAAALWKIRLYL